MTYKPPHKVDSPKTHWRLDKVLYDGGPGSYSVARGWWDNEPCLVMRWNGRDDDDGVGSPQSRGHATWFVIPAELEAALLGAVNERTSCPVICRFWHPPDYDEGAWRLTISMSPELRAALGSDEWTFSMPTLAHRHVVPGRGFIGASEAGMLGKFKEGQWEADVYSNGVAEGANPTPMRDVQEAFFDAVKRSINWKTWSKLEAAGGGS